MSHVVTFGRKTLVSALSFVAALAARIEQNPEKVFTFDIKADPRGSEGEYLTDGLSAVQMNLSTTGQVGAAVIRCSGSDLAPLADVLAEYDPNVATEVADLNVADTVKRTLSSDGKEVSFKMSLKPNSRTIAVPVAEWPEYVALMTAQIQTAENARDFYRSEVARMESEDAARTSKLAGQAAQGSTASAPVATNADGTVKRGPGRPRKVVPTAPVPSVETPSAE